MYEMFSVCSFSEHCQITKAALIAKVPFYTEESIISTSNIKYYEFRL